MLNTNSQNNWGSKKLTAIQNYCRQYETLGIEVPIKDYIVEKVIKTMEALTSSNEDEECILTIFNAVQRPSISIKAFIERIKRYSLNSLETYVYSLIYIDRYNYCHRNWCLTPLNFHK